MDFNVAHQLSNCRLPSKAASTAIGSLPASSVYRVHGSALAGGQQNQNGIHRRLRRGRSPNVGPTTIPVLFAHHQVGSNIVFAGLAKASPGASRHCRGDQRNDFRLRRRESSMTRVTPAPSQIAPCIARSIWLLLSCFWVPYLVT